MGKSIMVDPGVLETASSKMNTLATEYQTLYNKLFSDVDGLGNSWKGADNQAFVERIDGAKQDFKKMYDLLEQYASYLKTTAGTYRKTQGEIASSVSKLSV